MGAYFKNTSSRRGISISFSPSVFQIRLKKDNPVLRLPMMIEGRLIFTLLQNKKRTPMEGGHRCPWRREKRYNFATCTATVPTRRRRELRGGTGCGLFETNRYALLFTTVTRKGIRLTIVKTFAELLG